MPARASTLPSVCRSFARSTLPCYPRRIPRRPSVSRDDERRNCLRLADRGPRWGQHRRERTVQRYPPSTAVSNDCVCGRQRAARTRAEPSSNRRCRLDISRHQAVLPVRPFQSSKVRIGRELLHAFIAPALPHARPGRADGGRSGSWLGSGPGPLNTTTRTVRHRAADGIVCCGTARFAFSLALASTSTFGALSVGYFWPRLASTIAWRSASRFAQLLRSDSTTCGYCQLILLVRRCAAA